MKSAFYSIIISITSLLIVNSSIAGNEKKFDAICLPDKNKCRVYLNPNEFRFDEKGIIKSIPIKKISSWTLGGKGTKSDVGKILYAPLFPPAAIGLFTSSHQYIFTINYLDSEGIETFKSILFKNKKPADIFAPYLGSITGLANGSFTNKPKNNLKRNEAISISNSFAIHLRESSIYAYKAKCEFHASYTCLSYPKSRPIITK